MYKGLKYFFCEPNKIILYINMAFILIYLFFFFIGHAIWSKTASELFDSIAKYLIVAFILNIAALFLCIFLKNNIFSLIANGSTLLLFGIVLVIVYNSKFITFVECIYYILLLAVSIGNTITLFFKGR